MRLEQHNHTTSSSPVYHFQRRMSSEKLWITTPFSVDNLWITCGQTVDKSRPNQPQGGFSYFCWWVFHRLLTGFPQVFHRPKPSSQAARIVPRGARRPERRAEAGAPSQPRRSQEACQLPSGGRSAARRPERQQEACQESSIARSVPTVGAARSVPRAEAPQVSCQRCTTAAVR